MHSPSELTVSELGSPGFDIETDEGVHAHFSALQMFATSLGLCTGSLLSSYGRAIDVDSEQLALRISWSVAASPIRIDAIEMAISWPNLPESRRAAAERAAASCAIHNTLHQPPAVRTVVNDPERAGTPTPAREGQHHHHHHHHHHH